MQDLNIFLKRLFSIVLFVLPYFRQLLYLQVFIIILSYKSFSYLEPSSEDAGNRSLPHFINLGVLVKFCLKKVTCGLSQTCLTILKKKQVNESNRSNTVQYYITFVTKQECCFKSEQPKKCSLRSENCVSLLIVPFIQRREIL